MEIAEESDSMCELRTLLLPSQLECPPGRLTPRVGRDGEQKRTTSILRELKFYGHGAKPVMFPQRSFKARGVLA